MSNKLNLIQTRVESDYTVYDYECDFIVTTDGSGFWDCEAGRKVHVTGITVCEDEFPDIIYVKHDSTWDIYTDEAFVQSISEVLGYEVRFTEQGMQDDGLASLEVA